MTIFNDIAEALQNGDQQAVRDLTRKALDDGSKPADILSSGLIAGMDIIGEQFKNGDIFIPNVLIAARAMHTGLDILKPILAETGSKPVGRFVIGTVLGDHHDIGKNLVCMLMQGKGFEVVDLGTNVSPDKFVESVKDNEINILGMSALLSTTMSQMKDTIDKLETAGLRDKIKIMVGGGPLTQSFADEIGADGYAPDAASAAEKALELAAC